MIDISGYSKRANEIFRIVLTISCIVVVVNDVRAEDYSSTDIQYLYSNRAKIDPKLGSGTPNSEMSTVRIEHYGTFAYGDNYFNLNDYNGRNVGGFGSGSFGGDASNQQYLEWQPRLSLSKLTGTQLSWGIISDVQIAARLDYASYGNYHSAGIGPAVSLNIPNFDYFFVRAYWRESNYDGPALLIYPAWGSSFATGIGDRKFHINGYAWTTSTDTNGRQWFGETDLLFDVDPKGKVQVGGRLVWDHYKINGQGYHKNDPQLMVKWTW
jgi:nucleoside-specific outer membrane channel protein Tsx